MENIEKITNQREADEYYIENSFVDEKNKCICVPTKILKKKGLPSINTEIDGLMDDVQKKYKNFELNGRWSTNSDNNGVIEYLFFYK